MEENLKIILKEFGNLNKGQAELISRTENVEKGLTELIGRTDHLEKGQTELITGQKQLSTR
ncbi:MAG: hypothetical protein AB2392_14150 [Neobacillus sp.]